MYRKLLFVLLGLGLMSGPLAADDSPLRQPVVGTHALTGITLVAAPGTEIADATLVVRDGVIVDAGSGVEIPAGARVHDFGDNDADLRVYPGLIDAWVPVSFGDEDKKADDDDKGPDLRPGQYPHPLVTPGRTLNSGHWPASKVADLRQAGFTTAALVPDSGLFRGRAAVVNLGEGRLGDNVLEPAFFQGVSLAARTDNRQFPSSLMGTVALFRQVMLDAAWQAEARSAWQKNPAQTRPQFLEGLVPLEDYLDGDGLMVFESADMLDSLRIADLAGEFDLKPWMVGHGREYQRLDSLAETGVGQILPLDFPDAPDVDGNDRDISLIELRHWHAAPENPARVIDSGLPVVFTSHPHSSANALYDNLARALENGLDAETALAALTTEPAKMLGLDDRLGRLARGYIANFIVVEGELMTEAPVIREVWIDGRQHVLGEFEPPEVEPAGKWDLVMKTGEMGDIEAELKLSGKAPVLSGEFVVMGMPVPLAEARVSGKRLKVRIDGAGLGMPGNINFSLDIDGERATGKGSSPMGSFGLSARRTSGPDNDEDSA